MFSIYLIDAGIWGGWNNCWCTKLLTGKKKNKEINKEQYGIWIKFVIDYKNYIFQAYVGVSPDPNAIIIVFRGTQENRYSTIRPCSLILYFLSLLLVTCTCTSLYYVYGIPLNISQWSFIIHNILFCDSNLLTLIFEIFYSIQNWIEDLFWKQLDLNYPGMPDAMVDA